MKAVLVVYQIYISFICVVFNLITTRARSPLSLYPTSQGKSYTGFSSMLLCVKRKFFHVLAHEGKFSLCNNI